MPVSGPSGWPRRSRHQIRKRIMRDETPMTGKVTVRVIDGWPCQTPGRNERSKSLVL